MHILSGVLHATGAIALALASVLGPVGLTAESADAETDQTWHAQTPDESSNDASDDASDDAPDDLPEETVDEPIRRVVNCMATATPDYVSWGHRYTYWLSGVAEFDDEGNMLPIGEEYAGDWILTITNSRFGDLETHNVYPLEADGPQPDFLFPAVSLTEWNQMGSQGTDDYVTAFDYDEATHGLFLAIRNTEFPDSARQLFQVVHYLSDDYAMRSDVSACFVGPRPMVIGRVEEPDEASPSTTEP